MNLEALNSKIQEISIPLSKIADKMGISRQSLYLKLSGDRKFKSSEANSICEILRLTKEEKIYIFFNSDDDV